MFLLFLIPWPCPGPSVSLGISTLAFDGAVARASRPAHRLHRRLVPHIRVVLVVVDGSWGSTATLICTLIRLLNSAFGPRAGLPGSVLGRFLPASLVRTGHKSVPNCPGRWPGRLGPVSRPFALGLRPKPAQSLPREPGPGTGSTLKQL